MELRKRFKNLCKKPIELFLKPRESRETAEIYLYRKTKTEHAKNIKRTKKSKHIQVFDYKKETTVTKLTYVLNKEIRFIIEPNLSMLEGSWNLKVGIWVLRDTAGVYNILAGSYCKDSDLRWGLLWQDQDL